MTGYAGSLGLHGLGTAYLQAFRCGVAVERHVLGLEGGGVVAVLTEDAAQGCGDDALANVAARTGQHHGMQFLISHLSFLI